MISAEVHRIAESKRGAVEDCVSRLASLTGQLRKVHMKLESLLPPAPPPPLRQWPSVLGDLKSLRDIVKDLLPSLEELGNTWQDYVTIAYQSQGLVPTDVESDINEAIKCFGTGSYKAAVTMMRRAIEGMCNEKGITKGKLRDKIDKLPANPAIKSYAHGTREFGNYGAHPQNDLLRNVTRERADIVLRIGIELVNQVYGI